MLPDDDFEDELLDEEGDTSDEVEYGNGLERSVTESMLSVDGAIAGGEGSGGGGGEAINLTRFPGSLSGSLPPSSSRPPRSSPALALHRSHCGHSLRSSSSSCHSPRQTPLIYSQLQLS